MRELGVKDLGTVGGLEAAAPMPTPPGPAVLGEASGAALRRDTGADPAEPPVKLETVPNAVIYPERSTGRRSASA